MTQSDLFTWSMEQDPTLRSTIITILVLDVEPDWDRLVRLLDRGTRAVPRFRHRLTRVPLGLAPPRWLPDPQFDLSWHIRRAVLPPPGDLGTVLEFARREAVAAFDPARPLWQFTLLNGLDGDKSALVLKAHHSLTDGIGGIQIAAEMLDLAREGTDRGPVPEPAQPGRNTLADIAAWNWSTGSDLVRGGVAALPTTAWRAATSPIRAARDGAALATSLFRLARPIFDTLSPVMTERSLNRELSVLEVPLEALHGAAHRAGCTMNDAFVASLLIGLRVYHDLHGAKVDRLRMTMPISLRVSGDPIGGNRITLARFAVPVDIPDTVELIRAVEAIVEGWRHEPGIPLSHVVAAALNRLPRTVIGEMLKHVDFLASDVPGSPIPLYIAGAEVEKIYAFGPTIGTAFNATLISHRGTCYIGINADVAAVPDLPVLVECLAVGFQEVVSLDAERVERAEQAAEDAGWAAEGAEQAAERAGQAVEQGEQATELTEQAAEWAGQAAERAGQAAEQIERAAERAMRLEQPEPRGPQPAEAGSA